MYHAVDDSTSPVLVQKAAQAASIIEEARQLDFKITLEDDGALSRAYHALRGIVQGNDMEDLL